jgi:hypothetical protein
MTNMNFQNLADATVQIKCGGQSGSGFHYQEEEVIVSNAHVVADHLESGDKISAITESGAESELELLDYSPPKEYDFIIAEAQQSFPGSRTVLNPDIDHPIRGDKILFSGFPHGIDDLLVHEAPVSGPFDSIGFYIDGSVNGGNSGGPIISRDNGQLVGIVTQRRFLGGIDLDQVENQMEEIDQHYRAMGGSAGVSISGIDFGEFARLMSASLDTFGDIIEANANSGIGIGYFVEFLEDSYQNIDY